MNQKEYGLIPKQKVMCSGEEWKNASNNFFILDEESEVKPNDEVFFQNLDRHIELEFKVAGHVLAVIIWNVHSFPKKGAKRISVSTPAETQMFLLNKADRRRPLKNPNFFIIDTKQKKQALYRPIRFIKTLVENLENKKNSLPIRLKIESKSLISKDQLEE